MWVREGDHVAWGERTGTVLAIVRYRNGPGYVRLLLDDVSLPYWVELNYLAHT